MDSQRDRLQTDGPVLLQFPDHFFEVIGGVCIIYWEKSRSTASICCITNVDETAGTFSFQTYSWQGKSKKTFHDTGRESNAKASDVWRIVHSQEFETVLNVADLHEGLIVRIQLKDEISDFTGIVQSVQNETVQVSLTAENKQVRVRNFAFGQVKSVVEILSFPYFFKLRKAAAGEQDGGNNMTWEGQDRNLRAEKKKPSRKPRMLLRVPENEKYKRAWHFFQLFPTEEFEYCTKVSLEDKYDDVSMTAFNAVAYFAAWFTSRRKRMSSQLAYRKDYP